MRSPGAALVNCGGFANSPLHEMNNAIIIVTWTDKRK